MPEGFFPQSVWTSESPQQSLVPKCEACGLYKTCNSPYMPVSGEGQKGILIVGEAPGEDEDDVGEAFVGRAGKRLRDDLKSASTNMRRDCWLTNSLICRPPENRTPRQREIDYCRPNILNTISDLKPKVIILTGAVPIKSVIGHLWKQDPGPMSRWLGWTIPDQTFNAWICPTYHPSFILRMENIYNKWNRPSLQERGYLSNLKVAVSKKKRPWKKIPDYKKEITVIMDDREAARIIRKIITKGGPCSFDYETNMLKPDGSNARIVCCSICWRGKKTFAFPWVGRVIQAMKEFLVSPIQKSASNMKFEDRWSWAILRVRVQNWEHDSMLGAHWYDNRPLITGLKFQSFILFGMPPYNKHIEPFLYAKHSRDENNVDQIDLRDLLLYCGIDSLLEFKVRTMHRRILAGKETNGGPQQ